MVNGELKPIDTSVSEAGVPVAGLVRGESRKVRYAKELMASLARQVPQPQLACFIRCILHFEAGFEVRVLHGNLSLEDPGKVTCAVNEVTLVCSKRGDYFLLEAVFSSGDLDDPFSGPSNPDPERAVPGLLDSKEYCLHSGVRLRK